MNTIDARKLVKRVWIWVLILVVVLFLWPVEYRLTRMGLAAGVVAAWGGALYLWWRSKAIRLSIISVGCLPLIAVSLPGRAVDPDALAADYSQCLRVFRGAAYVWGGENILGIDCSGLVRQGLVWGQFVHGVKTLNGRPIRTATALWWRDASAEALRDGYRGWTIDLFQSDSISEADHSLLKVGDLAVTSDGIHILAYLGDNTWIEADPDFGKVIEVTLPTGNPWFAVPVNFVRWRWLDR